MKHVAITVLLVASCLIGTAIIIGCGEETEDPVTMEGASGTLGVLKIPDTAPGAPQLIPEGTPTVKSVGYYSDWKLSKPIIGTVKPGKTIFIKVVFSEAMKHTVADDNTARPILYYRTGKTLTRFRIAKHGAKAEDFVSGDAKPWHSGTDDYICKYTVPKEATGKFVISVGKLNADRDGNTLPAFYTHKEKLQIGEPMTPPSREKPTEQKQVGDTVPPTVLSVTHYLDKRRSREVDASDTVPDGTDVYTVVRFSESVTPMITYKTGNSIDRNYTLSQQRHGTHWRGVCKPTDADGTSFLCYATAWEDAFSVTITTETSDPSGNHLVEAVTAPPLQVRPVVITGPTPVVVADPVVPTPQPVPQQEVLGTDLVGRYTRATIPKEIESIFAILNIHSDIEIIVYGEEGPGAGGAGGLYQHPVAHIYHANRLLRGSVLSTIAAELFHAHQHTIAGSVNAWEQTPEGVAYREAERKDLAKTGPMLHYEKIGFPSYEIASSFFAAYWYWALHYGENSEFLEIIKTDFPNRYRWAEQWFGR